MNKTSNEKRLWNDYRRLNQQIINCIILDVDDQLKVTCEGQPVHNPNKRISLNTSFTTDKEKTTFLKE